jgi:hypothetical protein
MPITLSRAFLASALFLGLSAFQGKRKLALDRPYTDIYANSDTFTRDIADIKKEHSLDELHWQHLRMYPALAPADKKHFPRTGITYRQASQLAEKYYYSAEAQKKIKEATKGMPDAPPLVE